MIHLILALLTATSGISSPSDTLTTESVRITCVKAAEGDRSSEIQCLKAIRAQADAMLVDELNPDFQSSCLVIDELRQSDLIWKYLEWLADHPESDFKPASTTINAALLEKLPCGWREK